MKHVDVEALVHSVPVPMTKQARLTHWANLVRSYSGGRLVLFSGLEYMRKHDLRYFRPVDLAHSTRATSAFTLAVTDPTLNAEGLKIESHMIEIMEFFDLTQDQLHEFSCDCGGTIDNRIQADRIEQLAR
jgi:hypothetical protein